MTHSYSRARSGLLLTLLLALALPAALRAQNLTNQGSILSLSGGATLFVPGDFSSTGGTLDLSSGANTLQVNGNLTLDAASTLAPGTASTVVLGGSAAQSLDLNGKTLANLTINNSLTGAAAIAVPSAASLSGALTLTAGLVRTAPTATLTLLSGATLTGETSARYVAGNLAATDNNLAAGANAFANSLTLTLPTAQAGSLTVLRTAGLSTAQVSYGTNASGGNKGIDRVWTSSAPLPAGTTVALSWLSDDDNGLTNFGATQLWARAAAPVAGSSWTAVGATQNATGTRTVSAALPTGSGLGWFTASAAAAPLPVSLVAFTAERQGDAALLRWRTASETNNDRFEVEVSRDGLRFRQMGRVAGQGNSVVPHDYELRDPALLTYQADPVYYRLRQVDLNGSSTYSVVRTVRVESGPLPFAATAAPNPVGAGGTVLHLTTPESGPLTLSVYDAAGRLVLRQQALAPSGGSTLALPEAGQFATGAYTAHLTQGQRHLVLKLIHE